LFLCEADCQRCIVGEGMPLHRNPFEKGNLYIKFDVIFPPSQSMDQSKLQVCVLYWISQCKLSFVKTQNSDENTDMKYHALFLLQ